MLDKKITFPGRLFLINPIFLHILIWHLISFDGIVGLVVKSIGGSGGDSFQVFDEGLVLLKGDLLFLCWLGLLISLPLLLLLAEIPQTAQRERR